MKKKLVSISVIVLVLVLALFALSACNDGRTVVDQELISNGDFSGYENTDDGVVLDGWTIGGEWDEDVDSPYGRQPVSSDSDLYEDHGNGYIYLTTDGESGWVYLAQEIAVDRKAVYLVSVDVRVPSLAAGGDSTYRGVYVTFLENPDYFFVEQKSTTDGWVTLSFYVRPLNTDYLTRAPRCTTSGCRRSQGTTAISPAPFLSFF